MTARTTAAPAFRPALGLLLTAATACSAAPPPPGFGSPDWRPSLLGQTAMPGYKYQPHAVLVAPNDHRLYFTAESGVPPVDVGGDRIRMATSTDGGENWSANPNVLLAPLGGVAGDRGDDHLLGAPSVVDSGFDWLMLYEGYGKWLVALHTATEGQGATADQWLSTAIVHAAAPRGTPTAVAGCAPAYRSPNTDPVYLIEAVYALPGGPKSNVFITKDPNPPAGFGGQWNPLNGGRPIFFAYRMGGANMRLVSTVWRGASHDTVTIVQDVNAPQQGDAPGEHIGYVVADVSQPSQNGETDYALLNRVMLARSSDGVSWTRFVGPGPGGCVLAPSDRHVARMPTVPGQDILRSYGSGVPVCWIRGLYLEILFTDGTTTETVNGQQIGPFYSGQDTEDTQMWFTRIRLRDLDDPLAWVQASNARVRTTSYGAPDQNGSGYNVSDVKWSPRHQRYIAVSPANGSTIQLFVGDEPAPPGQPPVFPGAEEDAFISVPSGSVLKGVSLMGDPSGHVVSFDSPFVGSAFHLYPALLPGGNLFDSEFGHALLFSAP